MSKGIKRIGILTAGGDCPGLNAAIRAVGKAAIGEYGMEVIGILDGFRGLIENRSRLISHGDLSGILTLGGTVLGTGRDKPREMPQPDGRLLDMTAVAAQNYQRLRLDALVCLGGNGTQKNAYQLMQDTDIRVLTLPKTIDNDIWGTDLCFGYDTAVSIASEAVDRLHSTAESHHRIMVLEVMGNRAGWIALAAGLAGGADAIIIPEIPYDPEIVAEGIIARDRGGKRFSIVAIAEGAYSQEEVAKAKGSLPKTEERKVGAGQTIAKELAKLTGLETKVTVLGYVQRGGAPTPTDRILATRLGTKAAQVLAENLTGVMIGIRGDRCLSVPLQEVSGKRRLVPLDHPLIESARLIGTCLGDRC